MRGIGAERAAWPGRCLCAPTIEDLRAHLAPKVAKWWLPDPAVHVEYLPKTGAGKYQKNVGAGRLQEPLRRGDRPRAAVTTGASAV